ncbi:MAG: phospholipase D-like domain-containing protein [Desulfocapsaceae bacterium]|nr:phospholipase D-like domain-containing protein [Desulfocapsaceae bacterium]
MFVNSTNYEKVVTSIAEEEGELLVAVAFWGRGAELIVYPRHSGPVKIICNLKAGATNPTTIETLRNKKNIILKQHDRLHAKVIVGGTKAVVGSANFSSNGLNLEGEELQGWEEAGLLTQDSMQIDAIKKWFGDMWHDSRDINDRDIEEAKVKWAQRRATRIRTTSISSFSLDRFTLPELLEIPVYLMIWKEDLSDEAKNAYRKDVEKKSIKSKSKDSSTNDPPMYEDLNLPKHSKNVQLIEIYYGPRGGLKCNGVSTPRLDIPFEKHDGSEGCLTICRKDYDVIGDHFGSKEQSQLLKALKPHISAIWDNELAEGDEDGKVILLADVFRAAPELGRSILNVNHSRQKHITK